jgi:branched-chain amino acid transport system substrate-binding protein
MKLHWIALAATIAGATGAQLALGTAVYADEKPVKIALIADKTGPLESYAKQTSTGFAMGLEYATGGTMSVAGRKLVVIEKDSQTKPDVGRNLLGEAYNDDGADIAVGGTSSAVALAMLPVAQDNKKVLIVEPAVADSITGDKWNRYIFHTGRNSTQDAMSIALAIGKPGTVVGTLAPDYAFGRDFITAFRTALASTGAKLVFEQYSPLSTTDFTASFQRIFDALANEKGRKMIVISWAGAADPLAALTAMNPAQHGITLGLAGNTFPLLAEYKSFPGTEGAAYYYYEDPKNKVNDWLVAEHKKRFNAPPDFFTAGGFIAAQAIVEALKKTGGSTDTEKLIAAMEGMAYDSPKGKVVFRKEDHQLLQPMYAFKVKVDPDVPWAILQLEREIPIAEIKVPIRNTAH